MAKLKADYIKEAQALGLKVSAKNTVTEIVEAIDTALVAKAKHEQSKQAEHTKDRVEETTSSTTKAGKKSAKALREAETEEARKQRAAKIKSGELEVEPPTATKKGPVPVARPLIDRRSKNYRAAYEKLGDRKPVPLAEAIKLAIKSSTVKFDATMELHVRLDVDPRQADQNIRDSLVLPHGTGKSVRVAVFAPSDDHEAAKKAGADIVGEDDLLEDIKNERFDFDMLIATPKVMAKLGQFARVLGPKGLMPSPKSGTVTADVAKAVKEAKAGKIEYRVDSQGIVHTTFGKLSFGDKKLLENAESIMTSIKANKPSTLKSNYVVSTYVTTTMGPSVPFEI